MLKLAFLVITGAALLSAAPDAIAEKRQNPCDPYFVESAGQNFGLLAKDPKGKLPIQYLRLFKDVSPSISYRSRQSKKRRHYLLSCLDKL